MLFYFCNIHMIHLQHISETLETYSCNMRYGRNISLLFGRMETRRRVEFTGAMVLGNGTHIEFKEATNGP
jgi:hypothetical protein